MQNLAEAVEFKVTSRYTPERIQAILEADSGQGITAEAVLERARPPESPLHPLFEWDDTEAAEKYRLYQARVIINEIKVVIEQVEYPAFENVRIRISDAETERAYKTREEIQSVEEYRRQIIAKALGQMGYWKKQYESYKELSPIFAAIEETEEAIKAKWEDKTQ